MKLLSTALITAALAFTLVADDKYQSKTKSQTTDPLTGAKTRSHTQVKAESDGDYKSKSHSTTTVDGQKSRSKSRIKMEEGGDYKAKSKVDTPTGKVQTSTKVKDGIYEEKVKSKSR